MTRAWRRARALLAVDNLTLQQVIIRSRIAFAVFVIGMVAIVGWSSSYQSQQRDEVRRRDERIAAIRRYDNCISRRNIYDAALSAPNATLEALAEVLGGTQAQLDQAEAAANRIVLKKLKARPVC